MRARSRDDSRIVWDPYAITQRDVAFEDEERWITVGAIGPGSILLVVHTFYEELDEEVIRVISARAAESHERRAYDQKRKVIAVELQGHGHTADIDRPLTFEAMADDIKALMKFLGIEQADVLGYSLGGGVALQTAIRHPESVRKLVVVSATYKRDGWYPEVLGVVAQMGPAAAEQMKQSPLYKLYPNVNWAGLFTKLGDLLRKDYDWSKEVAAIKSPTMIVFADADAVRPAHIIEFFGLLGGGQKDAGCNSRSAAVWGRVTCQT